MPFYDDHPVLHDSLTIRGTAVRIMKTRRGAMHCDVEHEPNEAHCVLCGASLQPVTVYFAVVNGTDLGIYMEDPEELKELTRIWIEDEEARKTPQPATTPDPGESAITDADQTAFQQILTQVTQLRWGERLVHELELEMVASAPADPAPAKPPPPPPPKKLPPRR